MSRTIRDQAYVEWVGKGAEEEKCRRIDEIWPEYWYRLAMTPQTRKGRTQQYDDSEVDFEILLTGRWM